MTDGEAGAKAVAAKKSTDKVISLTAKASVT